MKTLAYIVQFISTIFLLSFFFFLLYMMGYGIYQLVLDIVYATIEDWIFFFGFSGCVIGVPTLLYFGSNWSDKILNK